MKSTLYEITLAKDVCEYILEHYRSEFKENLDTDHVYFKAYAAMYGIKAAKEMFWELDSRMNIGADIDNAIDFRRGK